VYRRAAVEEAFSRPIDKARARWTKMWSAAAAAAAAAVPGHRPLSPQHNNPF